MTTRCCDVYSATMPSRSLFAVWFWPWQPDGRQVTRRIVLKPHCCCRPAAFPWVATSKKELGPFMLVPTGMNARPSGPMMSGPDTWNSPPAIVGVGPTGTDGPAGAVVDVASAPGTDDGAADVGAADVVVVATWPLPPPLHAEATAAHTPTRTAAAVRFAPRMGFVPSGSWQRLRHTPRRARPPGPGGTTEGSPMVPAVPDCAHGRSVPGYRRVTTTRRASPRPPQPPPRRLSVSRWQPGSAASPRSASRRCSCHPSGRAGAGRR